MVSWNYEPVRKVEIDGNDVGSYNPVEDLPLLRENIIKKMQSEREASVRKSYEMILDGLYSDEVDKIVDDLEDLLGL